jgi:hypothetical protein
MGNSQSISPEEKWRRQLYENGVLIPPSFGVAGSDAIAPPSSLIARTPSLVAILQQKTLSNQLLSHHTSPGVWLMAKTNAEGFILASSSVPTDRGYQEGLLCLSQKFNNRAMLQLRAPTIGNPALYGSVDLLSNSAFAASSQMDTKGLGWAALNVDATGLADRCLRTAPRSLQLGSWTNLKNFKNPVSVSGYAAYQIPGVTLAVETTVPLSNLEPQLSYHVSCDLNDNGPPVVVNLYKSPQQTTLSFSQIMTFDRYHVNIFDDRAKKVRNTLGWTVEMSKELDQPTQLSAGVAWQVNRALALKVTNKPGGLGGVVIFKRWQQPRVTCALLFATPSHGGGIGFYGFGIELETFATDSDDVYGMSDDTNVRLSSEVPVTKTTLPK